MSYLLHVANVLYIAAFLVKDILWLRALSVVGGTLMVLAFVARTPPMWDGAAWDALFVSINLVQIGLLIAARRPVQLRGEELALYQSVFQRLSRSEFRQLTKLGSFESFPPGARMVERGRPLDVLRVICSGTVSVRAAEREICTLSQAQFVGEMAYLTGEAPNASVVALDSVVCFAWPRAQLRAHMQAEAEIHAQLQAIVGEDLVRKLRG